MKDLNNMSLQELNRLEYKIQCKIKEMKEGPFINIWLVRCVGDERFKGFLDKDVDDALKFLEECVREDAEWEDADVEISQIDVYESELDFYLKGGP